MRNLDQLDLDILAHLFRDAGMTNKDLAALVGVAPSTCLERVRKLRAALVPAAEPVVDDTEVLVVQERGRVERIRLAEVLYFKAEQKYVTVRTATRSFIMDGALSDLESRYGERFLRIHRNALVARRALRALEKHHDPDEGEGWAVRLQGSTEVLSVSRRQVAAVREELAR